jgi:hypothetical protein
MKRLILTCILLTGCSNLPERSAQDWSMQTMRNQDIFMQSLRPNVSMNYREIQQRMIR